MTEHTHAHTHNIEPMRRNSPQPQTTEADALRRLLEQMAGEVVIGPDAVGIDFVLGTPTPQRLNYQSISIGGFDNESHAAMEAMSLATMRAFIIMGNIVRLMRTGPNQIGNLTIPPVEGVPQGQILIWREGHLPSVTIEDGAYTVSMAFAVLPPWAKLVSEGSNVQ